jgi:HAD superfamily hydrolase (TIGR01459 family)
MLGITALAEIADGFDALVFDQWGVLHDGTRAYPGAVAAVTALAARGTRMAVLSNSGKRSDINAARIQAMGFSPDLFEVVMTSGEALWWDLHADRCGGVARLFPITAAPGDAAAWIRGLADVDLVSVLDDADAVLLMGLPDDAPHRAEAVLARALASKLPLLCSNPDRASPRAGGVTVKSPGSLAHDYRAAGGDVRFYGKPHRDVFRAVERSLARGGHPVDPARLLMIGDSPEHDIAGAHAAGWQTLFVRGGLHASHFAVPSPLDRRIAELCDSLSAPQPNFTLNLVC